MHEDYEDENPQSEEEEASQRRVHRYIAKMLGELEKSAKNNMRYLLAEGFLEPAEIEGTYKYTPEGIAVIEQQYRDLRKRGLL